MQEEPYIENEAMYTQEEEYSIEESEDMIEFDTEVDTKIEHIKNRFSAAELKTSKMSRHYIVREFEDEHDDADEYYYLKVNIFTDRDEFLYSLKYFQDLMTFTQQLAQTKKDVLRILNVRFLIWLIILGAEI
jgi:hypothetical protein